LAGAVKTDSLKVRPVSNLLGDTYISVIGAFFPQVRTVTRATNASDGEGTIAESSTVQIFPNEKTSRTAV
jgi:hypothetical protein